MARPTPKPVPSTRIARGVVKRIVRDKGFGFIQLADGAADADLFFHRSALPPGDFDRLLEGSIVAFEIGHGLKGPRAEHVTIVDADV